MGVNYNSSISTDGLVLYFDSENRQKSWIGPPTSNLIITTPYVSTTYTACTGGVTTLALDATWQQRSVSRYTITATGGVPRGRIIATGLSAGVDYSFSCKIKYNGPASSPAWYIDASKGNPEGAGNNNTFTTNVTSYTYIDNGWWQLVLNFRYSTCPTSGCWANFGLSATDSTFLNQTFDVYDLQFEQNSFSTPYVNGVRTTTQALLDITGNNVLTVSNLTYSADGSFSWSDGINAMVSANSTKLAFKTGDFSLGCWIYPTTFSGYQHLIAIQDQSIGVLKANNQTGEIYFYTPSVSTYGSTPGWTLTLNKWNHVFVVRRATTLYCYLNGVLIGSKAGFTNNFSTQTINIGNGLMPGEYLSKKIGIVTIYDKALSNDEVMKNFISHRGRYMI